MRTPHKHAEFIKAWADGCTIQVKNPYNDSWIDMSYPPSWETNTEYRIKPEKKVMYVYLIRHKDSAVPMAWTGNLPNGTGWAEVTKPIAIEYEE